MVEERWAQRTVGRKGKRGSVSKMLVGMSKGQPFCLRGKVVGALGYGEAGICGAPVDWRADFTFWDHLFLRHLGAVGG